MKTLLKVLKNEVIFGGHLIPLGAVSVVASFALIINLSLDWKFLLATYLGVYAVYLFDRYRDAKSGENGNLERAEYLKKKSGIFSLTIALVILAIVLLSIYGGIFVTLASSILFISGFAYNAVFKKLTKKIIGFKNFFVSISFVSLVLLFLYSEANSLNLASVLLIVFVYLRFFTAEAFYDLKDIKEDRQKNLLTFAATFRRDHFYQFITLTNVISALPIIYGVYIRVLQPYALALVLILPYFFFYSQKSKKSDNISLLSYIYCEGEHLLWLPLIIAARHIWR